MSEEKPPLEAENSESLIKNQISRDAASIPEKSKVESQQSTVDGLSKTVSAFSLSSIRAKKELEESSKSYTRPEIDVPTEKFTETEMLLQWDRYAQRLSDKGFKIMESLLRMNSPVLNGTSISIELPNEGSKLLFEKEIHGLLGHLKGHLHNHDITIEIIVNESFESKKTFNDQDRYNRLLEINPDIELLKTTFGLDLDF